MCSPGWLRPPGGGGPVLPRVNGLDVFATFAPPWEGCSHSKSPPGGTRRSHLTSVPASLSPGFPSPQRPTCAQALRTSGPVHPALVDSRSTP